MAVKLENYVAGMLENGFQTDLPLVQGHRLIPTIATGATITANQAATGYIISATTSNVTFTFPTGTLLGAALGAKRGVVFDLVIDNTSGTGIVTVATGTNAILSDVASTVVSTGSNLFSQLTVATGASGIGRFTLMFSSATAYVFARTA